MVSLLSAVRDMGRLREIYVVLVRHGFGELAQRLGIGGNKTDKALPEGVPSIPPEERKRGEAEKSKHSLAERVRLVAMDLGPSFVKLGQIASTRPDILPEEWITELKKLQDEVNPLDFEEIESAVEASLGASLEEIYESFEHEPLAAASIAQVHRAVLKTDEGPREVCVKVQRPKIADTVARDVEILHTLARFVEHTIPESHIYQPVALVQQFDQAITAELDFTMEAEHARRFAENFKHHPEAVFPRIYKEASSKRVMTMEFLDGHKVYEAISTHGYSGPQIAKTATGVIIKMIFEDGFFHADPHPGNILLLGTPEHPRIGLVDLGMVGRLTPEMRNKTVDMMVAAVRSDHVALADALYAIGTPTKKIDMRAYRAEVSFLADKYLNRPLKEIDMAAMIADLVKGATKYGLEIPADFLLVGKSIMTIEGIGKEIDPDLDVFEEARPYFMDLLRKRYAPERVATDVWRGLERLSGAAYDLPQQVREIMDDLRLGRLIIQTQDLNTSRDTDRLGRRIFAGLVVAAFVLAGAWLVGRGGPLIYIGVALLLFGMTWLFWHVVLDFRRR
ncbi:MAG: AarF/UbiB family protein [Polyangiaceae bacterium]